MQKNNHVEFNTLPHGNMQKIKNKTHLHHFNRAALACKAVLATSEMSACLSVCQTPRIVTKRKKRMQYERAMHLVKRNEEWLVRDVTFYLKFWTKLTHQPPYKNGDFQPILACSASSVTLNEKSSSDILSH